MLLARARKQQLDESCPNECVDGREQQSRCAISDALVRAHLARLSARNGMRERRSAKSSVRKRSQMTPILRIASGTHAQCGAERRANTAALDADVENACTHKESYFSHRTALAGERESSEAVRAHVAGALVRRRSDLRRRLRAHARSRSSRGCLRWRAATDARSQSARAFPFAPAVSREQSGATET